MEDICVVKSGDTYYVYAEDESFKKTVIHLPTSKDKVNWTQQGNVLEKVRGSDWENDWGGTPIVWKEEDQWTMLYEGGTPGDVALALSQDGKNWTRSQHNPVLKEAGGRAWDSAITAGDSLIKLGKTYHLFYHGMGGPWQTGLASSTDLVHWTRHAANPILKDISCVIVDVGNRYLLYTSDALRHPNKRNLSLHGSINLYLSEKP